jgi:hypothetical protein
VILVLQEILVSQLGLVDRLILQILHFQGFLKIQ